MDWILRAWKLLPLIAAGLLALPAAANAAPQPIGGLTELPGTAACASADGSSEAGPNTCQVARGIGMPESVTISPDGRFVYVGSYASTNAPGLIAFSRNTSTGALTQLPGAAGCYTPDGASQATPGCTKVVGLGNGDGLDLAITSDGRFAYSANENQSGGTPPGAIVLFARDPATGVLTQLPGTTGCISSNGSSQAGAGTCQTLATLAGAPFSATLSSDDRFLYVNDAGSTFRVHVLARNTSTGALSEVQCLAEGSSPPAGCTSARDVGDSQTLVLSPDGTHAYDGDDGHGRAISILDRDPATGLLTEKPGVAGCISDTGADDTGASTCSIGRALGYGRAISPDGHTLYVSSDESTSAGGVAILHVYDDGTVSQLPGTAGCVSNNGEDQNGHATCAPGRGLDGSYGLTISPDGRTLYVAGDANTGGLAVLSVDPSTGQATQLPGLAACFTADGASNGVAGQCTKAPAVANDWIPAVSPDGSSVYLAAYGEQAVTSFARETGPVCSAASATTAYQTPVTVSLSCTDSDGDPLTTALVTGPAHGALGAIGSTVTYTPANGYSGTDSFTFDASDTVNASTPVTATITVGAPPAP
ncbi:MAG: cadherin-like domain-containing protein, partial [Solirubrobacterales bacterium]|nr:cadherin-like domain-containing protein [Solirubrobacterales bacterium]